MICGGASAPDDALRVLSGLTGCCYGAAMDGPLSCTCWEPEFDLDQSAPDLTLTASLRAEMCKDCAYRADSPESKGRIPFGMIVDECADIELWGSFDEMLDAYEAAQP